MFSRDSDIISLALLSGSTIQQKQDLSAQAVLARQCVNTLKSHIFLHQSVSELYWRILTPFGPSPTSILICQLILSFSNRVSLHELNEYQWMVLLWLVATWGWGSPFNFDDEANNQSEIGLFGTMQVEYQAQVFHKDKDQYMNSYLGSKSSHFQLPLFY